MTSTDIELKPSARFSAFLAAEAKRKQRREQEWDRYRKRHDKKVAKLKKEQEQLKALEAEKQRKQAKTTSETVAYVKRVTIYHLKIERRRWARKLVVNLRSGIGAALKAAGALKQSSTFTLLGCSLPKLKRHLERQFRKGMAWDNYGLVWHVVHVKPIRSFNLKNLKEQRRCFSYRNLKPVFIK